MTLSFDGRTLATVASGRRGAGFAGPPAAPPGKGGGEVACNARSLGGEP